MRNSLRGRLAILVAAIAAAPVSEAGVYAFAATGNNVNEISISSSTYAHAEASSSSSLNVPVHGGNSYTSPPPGPCSFPCISAVSGQFALGAASIDGLTGKGRAHAGVAPGFVAPTGGLDYARAQAGFTLTDQLSINTATALMVTLNISFDSFLNTATSGANDFSVISAIYKLAFIDPLDSLRRYEFTIAAERNLDVGVRNDIYRITAGWDGEPLSVIEEGSFVPLALSSTIAVPTDTLFPTQVFDIELSLYAHATCQTLGPPACAAVVSSPNSSHIGFTGAYTSQSGYGYLGLDSGASPVPEPSTMLLVSVAAAVFGVRRVRGARHRSLR